MEEGAFNLEYDIGQYTGQFQLIYILILLAYIKDNHETRGFFCKEVDAVLV